MALDTEVFLVDEVQVMHDVDFESDYTN